ncbi:MAG: lipocalin family protein, partial [Mycobacterium sp.]
AFGRVSPRRAPAFADGPPATPAPADALLLGVLTGTGWLPGGPAAAAVAAPASATNPRQSATPVTVVGTTTVGAPPPDPALPGYTNGVTGVQIGHSTLDIPCGPNGYVAPADWYFPTKADGTVDAQGVIWLQHGFGAWNSLYSGLATQLSQQTNSIVVAPTLSSLPSLFCPGCFLSGTEMQQAVADLFLGDRSALNASAAAAGYSGTLPEDFIFSGHSAGGGLATAAAADTVENGAAAGDLLGVVMFDGVSTGTSDGSFTTQVNELTGVPIYQIAAPAQAWNAFGTTTNQLVSARPGQFDGVVLSGGSHVDSMLGVNPLIDFVLQLVTRPVPAGNTTAVYTLSTGWINDLYAGATPQDPEYGFYAGSNQPIIMGPTSAIALPTPIANQLYFGEAVLAALLRPLGITIPTDIPPQLPNGVAAVTVPPLSNGVTGVKTGSATLDIPCGDTGYAAPATWYFPTQADGTVAANGMIWLQHGFLGFNAWYSDMALALARETNSIVVAPDIFWFDTPLCPGCYLGSPAIREAAAEMFQGDRTALNISANAAGLQGPLPAAFLLTGHSAGGNFATAVGGLLTATPEVDNLIGVVMFDGVSRSPLFDASLAALSAADIPDYQIAAPPQRWNAYGVATELMTQLYPNRFNGVQIDNGSHSDVIAGNSLFADLAEIASDFIVKPSPPGAKAAVRTLATGWVNDIYAGNTPYGPAAPEVPLYGVYGPGYAVPFPYNPAGYNLPFVMGEAGVTTLPAPPPVNINDYSGKWYEQGSARQFFSIGLVNTTATYTPLPNGSVKVENFGQYFGPNGPAVNIVGSAVPVNVANTRLNVGFPGFFGGEPDASEPGNYWILDYAPDYSWAIVGDPQGTSGYILTRDQFIPEAEYNRLVARAYQLGVNRVIIPTPQYPS